MSRHDVDVKIIRDADGRILCAGVQWTETSPFIENMLMRVAVASFFATGVGVVALFAVGMNPIFGWGALSLVVSVGLLFGLPGNPRSVYFYPDGRMLTPYGISYRSTLPEIGGHNDDLVSIEARPHRGGTAQGADPLFELVMLSKSGSLICVSRNMHEWVALKAAAQLTHALGAIRKERADAPFDGAWASIS